ncbi:putative zinc-binding metallopeptidase [Phycisphaeraceae bacterium D3-23]
MRTFTCLCNETLFFDNTRCVSCEREAGFCPACQQLVALVEVEEGQYRCGNPACCATLVKCDNYRIERVCNRCIVLPNAGGSLCDCCRFNAVIPNLNVGDNRSKWRRIESAKRRLFYHLDLLGLPLGDAKDGFDPPLSFDFKEDTGPMWSFDDNGNSEMLNAHEVVMTGHFKGKVTINLREADPVERERLRVQFGELNRSLIGHFRHEIGHYYWELLVKGQREDGFKAVFGDHNTPTYAESMQAYYQRGPHANWSNYFASAYASMHPWEDFAETFTAYLEMVAALDTAQHMGIDRMNELDAVPSDDLDAMCRVYARVGIAFNELNRTMGLKDVLTRPLTRPVIEKMAFVHKLIAEVRGPASPAPTSCPTS